MRKIPEKVLWVKKVFSKYGNSVRAIKEETKLNFLKNKYQVRRSGRTISVLNQGFKFVVHLVSEKSHKEDKQAREVKDHWESLGFKVFFLEAFSDEDFFKLRSKIKNHKKKQIPNIKSYLTEISD